MGSTKVLAWGEFSSSLASTVQALHCHEELVDVTLAADGRTFQAHKLVLSAASPLLMELLKNSGCQHPVVLLAGITASDLEALLQFVYQGEVRVDPKQLPSLLQAANCLDIQALLSAALSEVINKEDYNVQSDAGEIYQTKEEIVVENVKREDDTLVNNSQNQTPSSRKRKRKHKSLPRNKLPVPSTDCQTGSFDENDIETHHLCPGMGSESTPETGGSDARLENSLWIEGQTPPPLDGFGCGFGGMMKISASDQPRTCPLCGMVIRQARNLRRHIAVSCKKRGESQVIELDPGDLLTPCITMFSESLEEASNTNNENELVLPSSPINTQNQDAVTLQNSEN